MRIYFVFATPTTRVEHLAGTSEPQVAHLEQKDPQIQFSGSFISGSKTSFSHASN